MERKNVLNQQWLNKIEVKMEIIPTHKAKGILSELIKRTMAGEQIFIGHYGKPVVALVPASTVKRERCLGILTGKLAVRD
ncbi:MAG: type II toxin-antitoxin system prevent-host-death family antitoxin [Prevotellaceae bacterium]|jgi:prevent-host-death family protein|nr:type II toxin-antitoxin system prevent-host-death family antitoxin [Prevotellaceae bacterium]